MVRRWRECEDFFRDACVVFEVDEEERAEEEEAKGSSVLRGAPMGGRFKGTLEEGLVDEIGDNDESDSSSAIMASVSSSTPAGASAAVDDDDEDAAAAGTVSPTASGGGGSGAARGTAIG
jgi:hypothetical protein